MRVAVVGTSGSGKSTFAQRLAAARGVPFVELDLLNWGPGWHDRSKLEPDVFIRSVADATAGPAWVTAGNYRIVRPLIWARASDVVWLDLPRPLVMRQVIGRSLRRAVSRQDVFPGCKEEWPRMFTKEHPIRWAWDTYHRRRAQYQEMLAEPAFSHLRLHRCASRGEVAATLAALSAPA